MSFDGPKRGSPTTSGVECNTMPQCSQLELQVLRNIRYMGLVVRVSRVSKECLQINRKSTGPRPVSLVELSMYVW